MGLRKLVIPVIVLAALAVGYLFGHQNLKFEGTLVPRVVNTELAKPREVDFGLFWQTWNLLYEKYIGELKAQELILGAIRGMVEAVGDPYTVFLPPEESAAFLEDLSGRFEGIGAEIAIRGNKLIIVAPLEGSPAEQAGLRPRDWIAEIDGVSTEGITVGEAIQRIRGEAGTIVKLTIVSEGSRDPREVAVRRETITIESVQLSFRAVPGGEIAYLKLVQFGPETSELMQEKAEEITRRGVKGVVLDVRNNPGGYLDAAIDITSLLVKGEVIAKEKKKDGSVTNLNRTLSPKLADLPLVVLVNDGSASASEILAGAVQDYGRGRLVGTQTFGKGSVQDLEELKGGSSLRVTVAKWLTPNDREINGQGITPDIMVELTDADRSADRDPQLDRALEELMR